MKGVSDLNGEGRFWQSSGFSSGGCHEHRQNAVRSTHGLPPLEDLPSHRRALRRRPLREVHDMRRPIPRDGLRSTDVPREPARHRSLSFGAVGQALPHGFAAGDQTLDAGRYQRGTRLAYPRRIRPAPDRASAQALCGRQLWHRVGEHCRSAGIICDQTVALTGTTSRKDYPEHLRRIRFKDPETGKTLVFLTNNFALPAATICALYKARWQVELFFKWIKQHLRIKKFYGNSENAVKSQIWIAVSVYVLVAIVKKRLNLDASLYTLLQIFSLTLFEKMPIQQAFAGSDYKSEHGEDCNQPNLFAF